MNSLREIATLPGPRAWPLVGNLFQIRRSRLHQNVETWGREFGPLFRFKLGPRTLLVVSDHEALGAALRDRPDGFRRTRLMEVIGREMGLSPGVFSANGEVWRRQRRMVMAGFDPTHVRAYFPSLLKVTQRLRGRWLRAAQAGVAVELQPELMRFTVDAISGLAFGADVNTLESDDEVIQRHLDKIFPALYKRLFSLIPWWRIVRTRADRDLARSVAEVNAAIAGFIAQARERLAAEPARREHPPNLLEAMIVAADEGGPMSDDEVSGNVMTMLLAGEDTTANTLAWMIYLLKRNPAALQRAQHEVRRRTGSAGCWATSFRAISFRATWCRPSSSSSSWPIGWPSGSASRRTVASWRPRWPTGSPRSSPRFPRRKFAECWPIVPRSGFKAPGLRRSSVMRWRW